MRRKRLVLLMAVAGLGTFAACAHPLSGQDSRCLILCAPELKIEPTITIENLGSRARVDVGGEVERTPRETIFEIVFAVGIPTEIPRVGITLEAIVAPFEGTGSRP